MVTFDTHYPQFTQAEAIPLTGATGQSLQNWTNRGLLTLQTQNPGRAERRLYSVWDLVKVRTMLVLTKLGISAAYASKFADEIVQARMAEVEEILSRPEDTVPYGWAKTAYLVINGDEPEMIISRDALHGARIEASQKLKPRGHAFLCIEIDSLILDIRSRVFRLLWTEVSEAQDDGGED